MVGFYEQSVRSGDCAPDAVVGTVGFTELKRTWSQLAQEVQSSSPLNPLNSFSISNVNVAIRLWIDQTGIQLKRFMGQKQNSFTPFETGSRQRSEANTQALGHELHGFF